MLIIKKIVIIAFVITTMSNALALSNEILATKKSVFKIITYLENEEGEIILGTSGTGFLINHDGNILTNNHVVDTQDLYDDVLSYYLEEAAKRFECNTEKLSKACKNKMQEVKPLLEASVNKLQAKIKLVDGSRAIASNLKDAEVIWKNKAQDIALLKTQGFQERVPLSLSTEVPKQLDRVFAIGYPGAIARTQIDKGTVQASITDGSISSIIEGGVGGISSRVIQHTADVNPGNSGGPLVDQCGRVVGINTLSGKTTQGIFLSSDIRSAIKALKNQEVEFNQAAGVCVAKADEKQTSYAFIASIIGIIVALVAVIFSLKNKKIVHTIETYTQYIRRTKEGDTDKTDKENKEDVTVIASSHAATTWKLHGSIKQTGESITLEISLDDLKQDKSLVIGRNKQLCDYAFSDIDKLSRQHVKFTAKNGELMIEDLNSSNKTYIDNKVLIAHKAEPLMRGSVLNIANLIYLTLAE